MPERQFPIGAEALPRGGVHFRVWAPDRKKVEVVLDPDEGPGKSCDSSEFFPLATENNGYFSGTVMAAGEGSVYKYRLDGGDAFPDPASKFQPHGPHGASQVVDLAKFKWTDHNWRGVKNSGQVIYELHIGTFTPPGTWQAASERLPHLVDLGITVIEVMPVSEFPGGFGWGYDGVDLFAPSHLYGCPQAFQKFVNQAHALGLGVILDVVYNHFGPSGNYLRQYSQDYFSATYTTEWGDALNYDGKNNCGVREFFVANAEYWIREFHLDGLRLDATYVMFDSSKTHVLAEISSAVRRVAGKDIIIIAENEPQNSILLRSQEKGGYGLDAAWNDDFHHAAVVALTGRKEAYYTDYRGRAQEFISAIKWGYLFQGQKYLWQKQDRGSPTLDLPPTSWVHFIENHDQVANSARGLRLHQLTSPGRFRAMTALLLLAPQTPMLFQGQEFNSSKPFLYFADHDGELSPAVGKGRKEFLYQFRSLTDPKLDAYFHDPSDIATYEKCKLDFTELQKHPEIYALHKDLIALRKRDPGFAMQQAGQVDGAVLTEHAFLLRYFLEPSNDRLMIVNFGADLDLYVVPEPFFAPPAGKQWQVLWSSEHPRYGGCGTLNPGGDAIWRIPGECAIVLASVATAGPNPVTHSKRPLKNVER